ncbi:MULTISPECIES: zinc metalloprotease HtpX [unclassified Roseitalea]|uniref:zinc metalloprotease HtpX n=1 Tax=unclassified Roseitalea TaxID=2639107 RepID=UPI00273F1276|nr:MULTISPECIES: zinc metalloprotease HtpX [unclassified Roseitalea]
MNPTLWHRLTNLLHSALLIGGMAAIVWACVSAIWGAESALWAFLAVGLLLLMTPSLPSDLVLTLYRARPIRPQDFPEGAAILQTLAGRANLERMPGFFYLPSSVPNAFATGHGSGTAIAISDGLLRLLDKRELAAVLAHEVSHIAHRDLWIMALADVMARVTSVASYVGQILLILNLPSLLTNSLHIPWHVPLLLAFSPTLMSLLQLALSRAREYDADLGAARLTGDPAALASALAKLDNGSGKFWEEILLPGRRIPEPSLLRTHPKTEDRIRRLRTQFPEAFRQPRPSMFTPLAPGWPRVVARPRWRRTGVWY